MMELDFAPLPGPEYWVRPASGASVEETVRDAFPGEMVFRVNGTDLAAAAPFAFFGFVVPFYRTLRGLRRHAAEEFRFSEYSGEVYHIERPSDDLLRIVAPSGSGGTVLVSEVASALSPFVGRVMGRLEAWDPTASHNLVASRMLQELREWRIQATSTVLVEVDDASGVLGSELLTEVRTDLEELSWSYGGFSGAGIDPMNVDVRVGPVLSAPVWDGAWSGSGPSTFCAVPKSVEPFQVRGVVARSMLNMLDGCGYGRHILCDALRELSERVETF